MNLLKDDFISTNQGKVSLRTLLTSDNDYQLQYYFDEIQLAMLQLLSSLATAVLQPSTNDLRRYLAKGLTAEEYDEKLANMHSEWFDAETFMQVTPKKDIKWFSADVHKMVSGIESSSTKDASGLFSSIEDLKKICPDCGPACNYNYQMNIHAKAMGVGGATGIRGGGTISVLLFNSCLSKTLLMNCFCHDYFRKICPLKDEVDEPMWVEPLEGRLAVDAKGSQVEVYQANTIGLIRGLFALSYFVQFDIEDGHETCDICGSITNRFIKRFRHKKFEGKYGATSVGRELGAGWWMNPYTPSQMLENGIIGVRARDQHWQSWEDFLSLVIKKETNDRHIPAPILTQFTNEVLSAEPVHCIVGGNILKRNQEATVVGRVYDLYPLPSSLSKNLAKVNDVVKSGLEIKDRLKRALNKLFGAEKYKKSKQTEEYIKRIRDTGVQQFCINAQNIIQNILVDVDKRDAHYLRHSAQKRLNQEAKKIYSEVQRKYQHDLPLFKALIKGEYILNKE